MQFGHNRYYDEKGNLLKEISLDDDDVTNFKNTYDSSGRIISQIGGPYKRFWEYDNGELVKFTEHFYDMEDELLYKNGLVYRENRKPEVYWTHSYDDQRRKVESTVYRNDNIIKKLKYIYSDDGLAPIEEIEWDEDGAIKHDIAYSYFIVGNDTLTIFKYDKGELDEIVFYLKDSQGMTEDTYKTSSSMLFGFQYFYENGILASMRDLKKGTEHKYVDDIVTITEGDEEVTETKYRRNIQISRITKDKTGKVTYSYVVDGDDDKKSITIIDHGETKKGEQIFENGRIIKFTDATNGLTNTVSYDDAGYVSEVKSSDGTVLSYKYEFDAQGNWVKEIEYKNGKPNKIWERFILYY